MQEVKSYPNGIFSWIDLATTDLAGAKAFYQGLFGWEAVDVPTDQGTTYTMFQIDGKNVAGGGEMSADMQEQGMPPFWSSYVKHDDVDSIAQKISDAGGNIMFPPMDVMEEGRMTMAMDPTGAPFGVWQPRNHIGAQVVNSPGALVWNELQTPELASAKEFYTSVFGWSHQTDENGYVVVLQDERAHAGMMEIDESWGDVPPNWAVYIMVEDVEATAAKAKELGGNLLMEVTSAGEMGSFIVIQDPQGAVFTAMAFNGPVDAPPGT